MGDLIILAAFILGMILVFRVAVFSIGKLGYKISPYYSFEKLLPKGGSWAVIFYIIALAFLVLIIAYFAGVDFRMIPA